MRLCLCAHANFLQVTSKDYLRQNNLTFITVVIFGSYGQPLCIVAFSSCVACLCELYCKIDLVVRN